ncbi:MULTISPECIES: MFS transporter [Kitasatospora]|uniref:Putative drug resistance protein n=1 Tax=Kitasatospora setae (strain ATCC 33774 / DSM 43861 / JCM 3304 / KCC A-0304 / NBRC 14216 / KM-6054) TaxID=452652 RepID=E4N0H7_KITSK|nr:MULTISPECIES: MFS transporter [Kitasatospora]BAJ31661.1 putative drug resistance protein [Kitasatospora setae KM-6054]
MSQLAENETARRRRLGLTLALLAFAQLIISIDYNIVYVALPEIGSALGFTAQNLQWVVSAYAVAFGGFLMLGGRACDLFGPRRMFVLGLSLYAGSSLLGALAQEPGLLIASRAVQGIGGAFLFPATLTLVSTSFAEGKERNRAFAVWGTAGGSGMIVGSLLGGVLTQAFGWSSVFYINVLLAGVAALLAFPLISPDATRKSGRGFDLAGALTSTIGITAVVFALGQGPVSGWGSLPVVGAFVAGAVLLALFFAIEKRSADPLLPLRLFANRNLTTATAVTFAYMGTFGTLLYFLTVYFQGVHGYNALDTGLAFLVPMVAIAFGAQTAGRLATRYGIRAIMIASLLIGVVGAGIVGVTMAADASYLVLVPGLIVLGVGQGAGYTLMFGAAAVGIEPQDQGIASGAASTTQQVGGAVGLAVLVAVANSGLSGKTGEALRVATSDGTRNAFYLAAVGILITAVIALGLRKPEPRATTGSTADAAADTLEKAGV